MTRRRKTTRKTTARRKATTSRRKHVGKGIPKKGYRMTKQRLASGWKPGQTTKSASRAAYVAAYRAKKKLEKLGVSEPLPETTETDAQIERKLTDRFSILKVLAKATCVGESRALIVSGPAGLSKSYTVEKALEEFDPTETQYRIVKGYVRPTGLYKALYQCRTPGKVLVFDDADSIFYDDVSLNFLKAVLDTTERRRVSYLAETTLQDDETAEVIPNSFDFEGACIFITNLDFDALIEKGHKLTPHLSALVSRAHYVDLAMKTRRDYYIRIRQVVGEGMLRMQGLTPEQEKDVMKFIEDNLDTVRELSLRTAIKVGSIRKFNQDWEKVAKVTCLRNR